MPDDLDVEIAKAKSKARALAEVIQARAGRSEIDDINANTASIIIQIAEKSAKLIPKERADAILQSAQETGDGALESIMQAVAKGVPVEDAVRQSVATVDEIQRQELADLRGYALKAWQEAHEKLLEITED